jgi:hypothetical protein
MAFSQSGGFIIATYARSASNLFVRTMLSQQDDDKVSPMEYHFGLNVLTVQDGLIENGLESDHYTEGKRDRVWDLYRAAAKTMMTKFAAAVANVSLTSAYLLDAFLDRSCCVCTKLAWDCRVASPVDDSHVALLVSALP